MPKAKKRVMTCSSCKGKGHNARACPAKTAAPVVEVVTPEVETKVNVVEPVVEPVVENVVAPPPTPKTPPFNVRRREAPTADMGSKASGAPHRCPKCNQVAILAIVRVKDYTETLKKNRDCYKGELRCEQCLNKPSPAELILVWGAKPGQTVDEATANA